MSVVTAEPRLYICNDQVPEVNVPFFRVWGGFFFSRNPVSIVTSDGSNVLY